MTGALLIMLFGIGAILLAIIQEIAGLRSDLRLFSRGLIDKSDLGN